MKCIISISIILFLYSCTVNCKESGISKTQVDSIAHEDSFKAQLLTGVLKHVADSTVTGDSFNMIINGKQVTVLSGASSCKKKK